MLPASRRRLLPSLLSYRVVACADSDSAETASSSCPRGLKKSSAKNMRSKELVLAVQFSSPRVPLLGFCHLSPGGQPAVI